MARYRRLWELEEALRELDTFDDPRIDLEQYPTSAHLASQVVNAAKNFGDIEGKTIVDLGCGAGVLSVACFLAGADHVLGVDIDAPALEIAQRNAADCTIDFVNADVTKFAFYRADTVMMNPPFGTRRKGIDVAFLAAAQRIATTVYSLHKSSTRDYLLGKATDLGFHNAEVLAELRFDIPNIYGFHKLDSTDIQVDLLRFESRSDETMTSCSHDAPHQQRRHHSRGGGARRPSRGKIRGLR